MLYLTAISAALMAGLVAYMAVLAVPVRSRPMRARMSDLGLESRTQDEEKRRQRGEQRRRLDQVIAAVGDRFRESGVDYGPLRARLIHAGYRQPSSLAYFLGLRVVLSSSIALMGATFAMVTDMSGALLIVAVIWGAGVGWIVPSFMLAVRVTARQKEITLALPDALDLLVICVEAGLGLNQALIRVAREIRHVSTLLSQEISVTNFQIRAGIPRDEALGSLAERTGVPDLKTLVTTMIQTERFGTSIATALRVHADTLRQKRMQRAEEAAAKTTIKMVFPLAICIFPVLFIVVLGPALIQIYEVLSGL
jgi:tight adherence protein C